MHPEGIAAHAADPPRENRNRPVAHRRDQDRDNDIKEETSVPFRWSKRAIAMRDGRRRTGAERGSARRIDATPRNHRDGAKPDRAAKAGGAFTHTHAGRAHGTQPEPATGGRTASPAR